VVGGSTARRATWLVFVLAWMVADFWVSSLQNPRFSDDQLLQVLIAKAGHFSGYALFGVLLVACIRSWTGHARVISAGLAALRGRAALALVLAAAWAMSDEIHQSFTPHRTPALTDVLLDSLGAACGIVLAGWLLARLAPRGGSPGARR
jgi:VanZ family protein